MQDIKIRQVVTINISLRDCSKANTDKSNRNLQHGFQEEDYLKFNIKL